MRRSLLIVGAAACFLVPPAGSQDPTVLRGFVGPDPSIFITDDAGNVITNVNPGTYTLIVEDRSSEHNFHLQGPGVNVVTDVDEIGTTTVTITLVEARYQFQCDPHSSIMRGTLVVGNPPPPPPPPPKPVVTRLVATVGATGVTLRTAAGRAPSGLKAGSYSIVVRDRSKTQNFHLRGPGVNRKTGIPFTGTTTWSLRLGKGRYTYGSDAARAKRAFTVA